MQNIVNIAVPCAVATRQIACDVHGVFESRNFVGKIWSKCPACASEAAAARKTKEGADERAAQKGAWEEQIGRACIPPRFADRTLKSYVAETPAQQYALAFATAYADDFDAVLKTGRCALFVGNVGTGKTHLAAGIALRLMRRDNRCVLFSSVMQAVRSIKDTWGKGGALSESQAIAALVRPDLLILDEVGVQFGSKTEELLMFEILNERYCARKPTLLMSNLPLDEVKDYLGERIFDRLREDGGEAVAFGWESYRGRVQEVAGVRAH